ncbi:hypothetical protein Tco_1183780 [Tanacetum coccineum]
MPSCSTDSHSTPIITQPSSSTPPKETDLRKKTEEGHVPTEPIQDEVTNKEPNIYPFIKDAQAKENASLKKAYEDASKQERKIADLDADEEEVSAIDPVTTAGEVVTTANVEVTTASDPTTTINELTLAQTLIEIKAAKPKAVTTTATTTTTTRPKARGVVVQKPSEFKTTSTPSLVSQLPQAKDKGKAIMVEPEKPSKNKDQIALDEELALRLHAEEQAELERMQKERVEKSSVTRTEESSKRARDELEFDKSKKQKIDKHVEAEKDDDQEEAEMKKHIDIVKDDECNDLKAIPLAPKPK